LALRARSQPWPEEREHCQSGAVAPSNHHIGRGKPDSQGTSVMAHRGDGKTALFQGQQAGRPSLLRIRNAARGAQIPSPWPFVVHFVIEFRPPCGLCNASDRYTTANSLIHPYGIYEMFVTTWLGRGLYSCRVMHGTPYPLSSESRERRICKGHPSRALVRSGQSIRIPIRSQHRAPLQSSDTDLTRDDIHVKSDTGSCFPCLQGD
jgi:hypothetical protein